MSTKPLNKPYCKSIYRLTIRWSYTKPANSVLPTSTSPTYMYVLIRSSWRESASFFVKLIISGYSLLTVLPDVDIALDIFQDWHIQSKSDQSRFMDDDVLIMFRHLWILFFSPWEQNWESAFASIWRITDHALDITSWTTLNPPLCW